jgi:8-amino-7-oxononanoate synthase
MTKLEDYCQQQLRALSETNQRRILRETAVDGVCVVQNGTEYLSFSGNDYLGLANHPEVLAAAEAALKRYGAGAGASRLVTGNHPLYAALEDALARSKQAEAALVFGSGYLTNIGVIPALVGRGDIIFADKLVHACLLDGAQLSGATLKRFRHNDAAHLNTLLAEHRGQYTNALILVDHVYSMDGDVAPLAELSALAKARDSWLMVDDAHGLGMVESHAEVDVWMGTLSKSAGSYGGYVVAKRAVLDMLVTRARSILFSTGLPPSACAAALASLQVMTREPERGTRSLMLAKRVCDALAIPFMGSAIVPLMLGKETAALAAGEALKAQGILAVAIRPPTVPPGTARLRLTFSAAHTDAQVERLIVVLKQLRIAEVPCAA